jgi:hypothetical protein
MEFGASLCPHGNFSGSCEICRRESGEAAADLEKLLLFDQAPGSSSRLGGRDKAEVHQALLSKARAARQESETKGGALDFLEALPHHEEAVIDHGRFVTSLDAAASALGNKKAAELTPREFHDIYERYPDRAALEAEEAAAAEGYSAATESIWRIERCDSVDARILLNDLTARRAARLPDDERRRAALDAAQEDLAYVIDNMDLLAPTAGRAKGAGHRAEYEMMYLLREWAKRSGLEHVVTIEHALPRDDQRFGIDFHLTVGSHSYSLDLKTVADDSYRAEHQAGVVAAAREKTVRPNTGIVVVDADKIRRAYREERDGSATRLRPAILDAVAGELGAEDQAVIRRLGGSRSERPRNPAKKGALLRRLTVPMLLAVGAIGREDVTAGNVAAQKILDAKNEIAGLAQKLGLTDNDLGSPEAVARLADAVRKARGQN